MNRLLALVSILTIVVLGFFLATRQDGARAATALPDPVVDAKLAAQQGHSRMVLAGGCFWGLQAVFEHVKGVNQVVAGYSGGAVANPDYEQVSSGETGHAESIEIDYDPSRITAGTLLKVFFSVAHDPTELNRQGPDTGTQYRSAIFYQDAQQQRIAEAYVEQLEQAKLFPRRIVTQIVPFKAFYRAEEYHQGYAAMHPDNPYIARFDLPKVARLQQEYPNLYH